jgi:hypothetical protein
MRFDIISQRPEDYGRVFRQYLVEGIPTIGVYGDEPFAIRFTNSSSQKIQLKLSLDGTDTLTGQLANLDTRSRMWIVDRYDVMELQAWPESHQGGARFVFTSVENSVALHTHGDLTAKGFISAAVFTEGYVPQVTTYPHYFASRSQGGTYRGSSKSMTMRGGGEESLLGGPAIGAGGYVEQPIRSGRGLVQPTFSQLLQIRYLWWDDLVAKLQHAGIPAVPQYPTGFHGGRLADLGNTPRIGNEPSPLIGYMRFK